MPVELTAKKPRNALPVWLLAKDTDPGDRFDAPARKWLKANRFDGKAGQLILIPETNGGIAGAVLGTGDGRGGFAPLLTGHLGKSLPEGAWYFAEPPEQADLACLGAVLGGYAFTRYGRSPTPKISLCIPSGTNAEDLRRIADGVFLARDLVNTPAADMGPSALERAVRELAGQHNARVAVTAGEALLKKNFPMIHAVGRAGDEAPRLIDMKWGRAGAPKVTLVGKGVTFDTGGLDIKPASGMLLMKKDMGGAANVLGLAAMIMAAGLDVRLRVLIPAVENAIAGNAFRPGDILNSRAGLTVEVGNTDAEGRLVLADALTFAVEEDPEILIDMATLTGAARVALGPDIVPFYSDDDELASDIEAASDRTADPVWRMPLWMEYDAKLSSKVAEVGNVTSDSFAGSVTAALFLKKFAGKARCWAHFDIFAWNPAARAHAPAGGEAQAIRALYRVFRDRYPRK